MSITTNCFQCDQVIMIIIIISFPLSVSVIIWLIELRLMYEMLPLITYIVFSMDTYVASSNVVFTLYTYPTHGKEELRC